MAITTFAAIYIGSYEVSLKIFELSVKKKAREIDHVRYRVELGRDTYAQGYIGYELVDELCDVLKRYADIMKGYRVDAYEACTSAAIRDSKNALFILDQIQLRTGLKIKVLSNSEHRFISYKSVALQEGFDKMIQENAAVVDVGGGSVQITLFIDGKVVTTQNIVIGSMRIREKLSSIEKEVMHYENEIRELVDKELGMFRAMYIKANKIKYVVMLGDYISEACRKLQKKQDNEYISRVKFIEYTNKLIGRGTEEIAEVLNLSNDSDPFLIPSLVLYQEIFQILNGDELYVPGVDIIDGIACDYAQRHNIIKYGHDFDDDVISAARSLSERYMCYSPHIDALSEMSEKVFDAMKKIHGMGKREKLLLKVAAIVHDCGKYISLANNGDCAYEIIMSSEIIGLTHLERQIVAFTVKYNAQSLPEYEEIANRLDKKSYLIIAKLTAILKLSNAMDRSHKQKFKNVKISLKDRNLYITIESEDTILLEKGLFAPRAEFFERIFSVKPVMKEKNIYNVYKK